MLEEEAAELGVTDVKAVPPDETAAAGCEVVLVLGGDGTFLRAAELARPGRAPLLGVNLGRVGFLAETEPEALPDTVRHVVERAYQVEERLTLDVDVRVDGQVVTRDWALNEASVEKTKRERMLEVVLEIDDRPLTSFGCDGVVCATRPARPRTRSPPAGRSSGRRCRRCWWCRTRRTRCSPARW